MAQTPEETLLVWAVGGDEDALTTLLNSVAAQLHAETRARIGSKYSGVFDADDILQITFLEAFLRIGAFEPGPHVSFLAWLRRIAENNIRDAIRELERDKRPPP